MFKKVAIAAATVAAGIGALVAAPAAQAQDQFVPLLVYRTGQFAPLGIPWADGKQDYIKLVNAKGGINGVKIAYEGLSWGRSVNEFTTSWDVVCRADTSNLGIGLDSFHILAAKTPLDALELIDRDKIFLVQLSDFMWHDAPTFEERMATARTFRVFPGEGVHSERLADLVLRLDRLGYRGDYSFEVFNDDYQQLPLDTVAERARRSAQWLNDDVLHRPVPLPAWARTGVRGTSV